MSNPSAESTPSNDKWLVDTSSSTAKKSVTDEPLARWTRVVEARGGLPNRDGSAVKVSCPLHDGGGHSLQVEMGKNGYPMLNCFGGCADERERDVSSWLRKVRKALVSSGVAKSDLAPATKANAIKATAKKAAPLPTDPLVGKWHRRLLLEDDMKKHRAFLRKRRGLSKETIIRAEIGRLYTRFTIPVRDADGVLVNVRKYDPLGSTDKMIGMAGHNSAFVYPLWALTDGGDKPILWTEGELDALLANQKSNGQFIAITGTGGAGKPPEDLSMFKGRTIYLAFDCDDAGTKGARTHALQLLAAGARAVHVVDLGLSGDGDDVTDWFIKHGRDVDALWSRCERTEQFDPEADQDLEPQEVLWLSAVDTKPLSWLWRGRIPYGKLTMLEGDPGLGKSTLWMDWVARVTTGEAFPGSVGTRVAGRALIVAGEDDLEDTIVPRLMARVASIPLKRDGTGNLVPLAIPDDLQRIHSMIRQHGITFLVIDPVMAFLGEDINSHNDASTRKALSPLVEICQKTGAACVLVRHLNKSGDMQAIYRGGGSIAFIGTARSGLVVGKHPEEDGVIVLAQTKTNLSRDAPTLTYSIAKRTDDEDVQDTYIEWGEELEVSADDLFGKKDARTKSPERDRAEGILREVLTHGPVPVDEVKKQVTGSGISWRTFERAKDSLGVEVYPNRDEKGRLVSWMWARDVQITVERPCK